MPRPHRRATSRLKPVSLRLTSYRSTQASPAAASPSATGPSQLSTRTVQSVHRASRPRPRLVQPAQLGTFAPASLSPDRLALTLPVPPSINHQYATVNGRRVLSAVGRGYKALVAQQTLVAIARSPYRTRLLQTLRASSLALTISFHFTSPLRRDVDGGLKIAQDALCEALGLNDNRIVEIHLFKEQDSANPRIDVLLCPCL